MKMMLFGADGLLGRALVDAAADQATIEPYGRGELDICDATAVDALIAGSDAEFVINCAAYTDVDAAESEAERAFQVNGEAPGQIAEICARHGRQLIHLSTDYVFDGEADTPYPVDADANPVNEYGRSKRAGELAALAHGDPLILRSSWLYAAYGTNFLTRMLQLMTERDELRIVADQMGTPTHAASLARAILALAEKGATGIHHYTDSGSTTWHGFAAAIEKSARAMGVIDGCTILPISSAEFGSAVARPAYSVLGCSASWAITGQPDHWTVELDRALDGWKAAL